MRPSILVLAIIIPAIHSYFFCPKRCQCYEDPNSSLSVHLICRWEDLNSTDFRQLQRPDTVRTLTIRCPYYSKNRSTPPAGLFVHLQNLDRLEIDHCLLTSLPSAFLSGLHNLYSLIIKNAGVPSIPEEMLRYTPNLMTLELSGNELRFEPYSIRTLRSLVQLDLSNNSITLFTTAFMPLTNLTVLAMDNNKITTLDFRRLPEYLTDLSLRNNLITTVHYYPEAARNLKRIDLAGNLMNFVDGNGPVNKLPPSVKQVDLSRNRITNIKEGAFGHMKKLGLLDLRWNLLTELSEDSLSGPQSQLRVYLEGNPFRCHCGLRWLLHARQKTAPVVLDLPALTCTQLLDESQVLSLVNADRTNQFTCEYETLCPSSCTCCEEKMCSCRSSCPAECHCYSSANTDKRNSQNTVVCERLRLDHLSDIPHSTTELRIDSAKWKSWDIGKFQKLHHLTTLRMSNTRFSDEELESLASINTLTRLQLSSTTVSRIPPQFGRFTHLQLADNQLPDLTADDIKVLNRVKRISLGGNSSSFTCDCDSPTPLQLWLYEKRNRDKVEDLDEVLCFLPSFGVVPVISTLPSNDSLCQQREKDSPETARWYDFVSNVNRRRNDSRYENESTYLQDEVSESRPFSPLRHGMSSHPTRKTPNSHSIGPTGYTFKELSPSTYQSKATSSSAYMVSDETIDERSGSPMSPTFLTGPTSAKLSSVVTSTTESTTTPLFTTPRQRRKYSRDNHPNEFLNALIFILFVCVLILIVTIAFTLYYRFIRIGRGSKQHEHSAEAAPLNGVNGVQSMDGESTQNKPPPEVLPLNGVQA
ncbi:hypothetical protein V3C99_010253 [Haemonchus contortus]